MHPIASLFASLELADEARDRRWPGEDSVSCPGVEGENLAAVALRELSRRRGCRTSRRSPCGSTSASRSRRASGGGSADAAAVLRGANRIAGSPARRGRAARAWRAGLGSDVPSQVEPRHAVVTGTGEILEPIDLPPVDLLLVPDARGLTAAEVYAELDRPSGWREQLDPEPLRRLAGAGAEALAGVLENDLEPPARSRCCRRSAPALDALRGAGALGAAVSGSGPTCFGLFAGPRRGRAPPGGDPRVVPDAAAPG